MEHRWTVDQLAEAVRLLLESGGYNGQDSGRVRGIPDKRTIRYYTTMGVLDRPLEFRGRTAYYGLRHLLQLVAIKRLQAQGLSLVDVQRSLTGADDAIVARLADLPPGWEERLAGLDRGSTHKPNDLAASTAQSPSRSGPFWSAGLETSSPSRAATEDERAPGPFRPQPLVSLLLAPGVRLVLEGADPARVTPEKLDRLAPILVQLVSALDRLGLTSPHFSEPLSPQESED